MGLLSLYLSAHSLVLEVLQALTSHTQIVKEAIQKGKRTTTPLE